MEEAPGPARGSLILMRHQVQLDLTHSPQTCFQNKNLAVILVGLQLTELGSRSSQ